MIRTFLGRSAVMASVGVMLASCAPTPENCQYNQTATGAVIGAGAGAVLGGLGAALGHASTGTGLVIAAGGALVGAAIGGMIGHQGDTACHQVALRKALDNAMAQNAAMQTKLQSQQASAQPAPSAATPHAATAAKRKPAPPPQPQYDTVAWTNKGNNDSGKITPLSTTTDLATKQDCATVKDVQVIDGQTKELEGRYCKGPDGDWKLAS